MSELQNSSNTHGSLISHILHRVDENAQNEQQATLIKKLFDSDNLTKEEIVEAIEQEMNTNGKTATD